MRLRYSRIDQHCIEATEQTKKKKQIHRHTHTHTGIMYTHTDTLMCVYIMAIATTKRGAGERSRSRERDAIFQCIICSPFTFAYIHMYVFYYIILRATRRHNRSFFFVTFRVGIFFCFFSSFVLLYAIRFSFLLHFVRFNCVAHLPCCWF